MTDLPALRAIAEKATPGPWHWVHIKSGFELDTANLETVILRAEDHWSTAEPTDEDAEFIATFNPATVLQLLALLEMETHLFHQCAAENDILRARIMELEKER